MTTFKTTLLLAACASDTLFLNGQLCDVFLTDEEGRDGFFQEENYDDGRYEFLDQEIEIDCGLSTFVDVEGERYHLRFTMIRRMTELDVIAHRLKN
ncbi:MAG: hypothetical protein HQ445_14065 [Polaromonas sp.]|nr:hypothetical protein [Polaromonas sp.]